MYTWSHLVKQPAEIPTIIIPNLEVRNLSLRSLELLTGLIRDFVVFFFFFNFHTGNYTQYLVIIYKGKESIREYICIHKIYIYITESVYCTLEINTL